MNEWLLKLLRGEGREGEAIALAGAQNEADRKAESKTQEQASRKAIVDKLNIEREQMLAEWLKRQKELGN